MTVLIGYVPTPFGEAALAAGLAEAAVLHGRATPDDAASAAAIGHRPRGVVTASGGRRPCRWPRS